MGVAVAPASRIGSSDLAPTGNRSPHTPNIDGVVVMKTIAQFVRDGIHTLSDLQDALQTAMRLEFSTIPPYLCAEWSIDSDPDGGVTDRISTIAQQEMFH